MRLTTVENNRLFERRNGCLLGLMQISMTTWQLSQETLGMRSWKQRCFHTPTEHKTEPKRLTDAEACCAVASNNNDPEKKKYTQKGRTTKSYVPNFETIQLPIKFLCWKKIYVVNVWHTAKHLDKPVVPNADAKFGWRKAEDLKIWPKHSTLNKSA